MRQKLDNRIRVLIENNVAKGHRTMFAVVGEKVRNQVPILYHILTKATVSARPSVLWCYKKELGFSTHRKKRMKELKYKAKISNSIDDQNPFDLFVTSTNIRYCYYNETHSILGNTYGALILQDFEALTPNLLARTIETVEGGGIIVFLLKSVTSLHQLYTISMDVHNRYRTSAHSEIVPRFNERFILSLSSCPDICVLDDSLNILPLSSHLVNLEPIPYSAKNVVSPSEAELKSLKEAMKDTKPIGPLLNRCKTACQGKALLRLLDVITEKTLNITCSLTAARGRGKSASLGLALAGAIAFGYTNIFVTSPSPENLRTLFEFIVKGFDTLDYHEHTDYELVQSTNPEFRKALVRINVFREHRQVIQYIHPTDAAKLGQAELVVVDEAAAIPLPLVKDLISGPYMVFLASTINGYEGTGRSLSLKLLHQLRQQSAGCAKGEKAIVSKGRVLHEMTLEESIRYKPGDKIEQWLSKILCLDACSSQSKLTRGTPPPTDCELFYVNRDTLFSFHKASETFLHQLMGIYVSAHYKNTPNDLQMLSDAPAHHLFVLMAPVKDDQDQLPDILAVVQVCLEGNLTKEGVKNSLERGKRAAGDLVPWTISQQFMDSDFPTLCGGRIVRVAVHPDYQSMGYGSRAIQLLEQYYLGNVTSLDEDVPQKVKVSAKTVKNADSVALLEEQLEPRADLPPLLLRLVERKAERLDYLGVSFGLTLNLLKFWKKSSFVPVYLRQTPNDLTGEYTCIMLKTLELDDQVDNNWLAVFWAEFRSRLINLLSFSFKEFQSALALSLLQLRNKEVEKADKRKEISRSDLDAYLSNMDLKRLSQYAKNMADHLLITDLLPTVARLYFDNRLPADLKLPAIQAAILLGLGLQRKSVDAVVKELDMPSNQIFALYNKTIRRLSDCLDGMCENAIRKSLVKDGDVAMEEQKATEHLKPLLKSLEEDLEEAADEIRQRQEKDKKAARIELSKMMKQYEITADQKELEEAYSQVQMKFARPIPGASGTFSVKSKRAAPKAAIPDDPNPKAKRKMHQKKFQKS